MAIATAKALTVLLTPKCSNAYCRTFYLVAQDAGTGEKQCYEAYCFPGGVIQALLREIGAGVRGFLPTLGWDRLLIHAMVG